MKRLRRRTDPRRPRSWLHPLGVASVVVVFGIALFLTVDEQERERNSYDVLFRSGSWIAMQLEFENLRLIAALDRFMLGEIGRDELRTRLDILWSRFPVALEGREAEPVVAMSGVREMLTARFATLRTLSPAIETLSPGDRAEYRRIGQALDAMAEDLHAMNLRVKIGEGHATVREAVWASQDKQRLYTAAALLAALMLIVVLTLTSWRNRVLLEREAASRMEAEASNRAKSEFLANMSHELRTPLNAIIGFSEIIRSESLGPLGNEKYREYVADIHDAGSHLLGIIADLLDLARVEAGETRLEEEEFDVAEAVAASNALLMPRARAKSVALDIRGVPPGLTLLADRRLFRQIMINLTGNAVKFTDEQDTVRVEARYTEDGALAVAVIDHGPGIAPEDLPRVMQPFCQAAGAYVRGHDGSGLGLPLARSFMELHGGTLDIDSRPGEGTRAELRFPPSRVRCGPAPAAPAARASASGDTVTCGSALA